MLAVARCRAQARALDYASRVALQEIRLFFYSNEGSPREPLHVHVRSADGEAKLWLEPVVSIAISTGYDAATLRELVEVATANLELIERSWHEHFA